MSHRTENYLVLLYLVLPYSAMGLRTTIVAAVALLVAPRTQAGVVDPKYAVNLTLYHVNEKNYTSVTVIDLPRSLAADCIKGLGAHPEH